MSRLERPVSVVLLGIAPALAAAPADAAPVQQFFGVLMLVLLVLGSGLGLTALLVALAALRPRAIREHGEALMARPVRHFSHGLLTVLILVFALALLWRLPGPVRGALVLVLAVWVTWLALRGLAAVAHELGDRVLASLASARAGSPVANVAVGAVPLVLLGLLPFVGWAAQLLVVLWSIGPRWGRRRRPSTVTAPAVDPAAEEEPRA